MKKVLEKLNLDYMKQMCPILIIVVLICLPFMNYHLTTDGYQIMYNTSTYLENPLISFSGRPISDFILYYLNSIGMNINIYQILFNFLGCVITFIASVKLYRIINNLIQNQKKSFFLLMMSSIFIFYNSFGFELVLFNVFFSISLQYLLIVKSVEYIVKELNTKNIVVATLLTFLGLCIYQGASVLFLPLALILIGYKNKNEKFAMFIIDFIKIFAIYGFACVFNLLYIEILPVVSRYDTGVTILESIKSILSRQPFLWESSFNIFPKYTFLLSNIVLTLLSLILIIRNKDKINSKLNQIITLIGVILSTIVFSYLPLVFSNTLLTPRVVMIISSLPGLLLLFILMFNNIEYDNKKINLYSMCFAFVILYSFLLIHASSILVDSLVKTNKEDALEIKLIDEEIKQKSSENVNYLVFFTDQSIIWGRNGKFLGLDIAIRAHATPWSRLYATNYYADEDYKEKTNDLNLESMQYQNMYHKYEKYCTDNNWDSYNSEQINVYKDTAFICVY